MDRKKVLTSPKNLVCIFDSLFNVEHLEGDVWLLRDYMFGCLVRIPEVCFCDFCISEFNLESYSLM